MTIFNIFTFGARHNLLYARAIRNLEGDRFPHENKLKLTEDRRHSGSLRCSWPGCYPCSHAALENHRANSTQQMRRFLKRVYVR